MLFFLFFYKILKQGRIIKMKVLIFSEEILSIFDIFSIKVSKRTTNKCLRYIYLYVLMISQCVCGVSSAAFFINSPGDLLDWMQALVQAVFVTTIAGAFLCLALKMKKIEHFFHQLQDIVNDGKFFLVLVPSKNCQVVQNT